VTVYPGANEGRFGIAELPVVVHALADLDQERPVAQARRRVAKIAAMEGEGLSETGAIRLGRSADLRGGGFATRKGS
jgi:hypothetical protein